MEDDLKDEAIVAGLVARDKRAFEQFWRCYFDRIYPICAYILGNGPDALDMTVDILTDFIEKHVEKLSAPRAMFSFLRQMAVRRSIRLRDRKNKFTALEADVHVSNDMTPEERAGLNLLKPLLDECLDKMTPKAQTTLRLKYTRKISNEKTGALVGGSKSYIGRLLNQGREALRKCIENKASRAAMEAAKGGVLERMPKPQVSYSTVERLLAEREPFETDVCEETLRLCEALEDFGDKTKRTWANDHLAICSECREVLLILQSIDMSADQPQETRTASEESDAKVSRLNIGTWRTASLAAAAAVLVGLAIVLGLPKEKKDTPEPGAGLTVKGQTDAFFAAVQRGATSFTARPLDRLMKDDKLGLFYSSEDKGYLAIFSRDANGDVALLYPASGVSSAAISAGQKIPLKDGAVVGEGQGCEWLVAVFSKTPLDVSEMTSALTDAKSSGIEKGCELKADVPDARTVRILPVKR